jgi:hypothetical protein
MAALPAMSSAPARRQSGALRTASISMWPMRPEAPAIAMRRNAGTEEMEEEVGSVTRIHSVFGMATGPLAFMMDTGTDAA